MNQVIAEFALGGAVGVSLGYFLGRTRAEVGRARADARASRRNRRNYRK
jgi:membrane protein YqaA with SNARE-associated domain